MIGNIPYTPRVKKVLALAAKEAKALNHSYVGTEHILLGLLREGEGIAAQVLKSLEVDPARTRNEILKELDPNFTPPESEAESLQEGDKKDVKTPALRAFGRDLTELAKKGELDPVIGAKIVDLEVAKIIARIRAKDIEVHLDRTAVEFLIDKGYDPIYGARPMRRAVEKYLEDPLAEELLRGNIKQGDKLEVHAAEERLSFKADQPQQGEPCP